MDELLFTPAAVLDVLTQIDELKDVDVGITENSDGTIQLTVGGSIYEIRDNDVTEIEVDESSVEEVEDANQSAYSNLESSGEVNLSEPIESGVIKEVAKTLLVGGLVRLTAKLLG